VTFSYAVAGSPDAIFLDGEGVAGPSGSVDRCPTQTREHELTAKVGDTVVDRATLTVVVIQPSPSPGDTQGPQLERVNGPSEMDAYYPPYCEDTYPFQAWVRDDSGVRSVKLLCSRNQGAEQSCGALQLLPGSSNVYRIDFLVPANWRHGDTVDWRIRACDNAEPMNCTDSPVRRAIIQACLI
jgi:hypothetical protein